MLGAYTMHGEALPSLFSRLESAGRAFIDKGVNCGFFAAGPFALFARADRSFHDATGFDAITGAGGSIPAGPELRRALLSGRAALAGHYAGAAGEIREKHLSLFSDPTGWQRLFYLESEGVLYFSSSVRALLAAARVSPVLNIPAACEFLLNGAVLSADSTLFSGVKELLPGHMLLCGPGCLEDRISRDFLRPSKENLLDTPAALARSLMDAVASAIGADRQIAVSLSGGVDSAVMAACAADLLGAKNVQAFTYEFDDPSHVSEVPEAAVLCKTLGLSHRTLRVTYQEYFAAVSEAAGFMEAPAALVMRTRMMAVSKRIKQEGFSKVLTGHGIEQLLGLTANAEYLSAFARRVRFWPVSGALLCPVWRSMFSPRGSFAGTAGRYLCRLYTGLKRPPIMSFYHLVGTLERNGFVKSALSFYPPELRPLAKPALEMFLSGKMLKMAEGASFGAQLRYLNYAMIRARIMRAMSLTKETGCAQVSPAMFLHADSMASYLRGRKPPGRKLLAEAMKKRLPPETLYRQKRYSQQAMISEAWVKRMLLEMSSASVSRQERLKSAYFRDYSAGERYFTADLADYAHHGDTLPVSGRNIIYLAFWDLANGGFFPC